MIIDGIYGIHFKNYCDNIGPDLYNNNKIFLNINKSQQTIYCGTEYQDVAFKYIKNNPDKNFILITHNSDHPAVERDIPNNINRWYTQNLDFIHDKVSPLPIGFENPFWHPWKESIINNTTQNSNRIFKPFAQFNTVTYPAEREIVIDLIKCGAINADIFYCKNGENYQEYVNNMYKYTFCLCPRGNGIDTHRIWEAIYFGCIPIVKKHITHIFEYDLPIIFVNDWSEINEQFLIDHYNKINFDTFKSPILSMQYWVKKIFYE